MSVCCCCCICLHWCVVQLPSPTLHSLCEAVQPHLGSFKAAATCSLLQLMSREGEYPPSPVWMDQALAGLEPQISTLEALPALHLLQSLKEFHTKPPTEFMVKFQGRLVQLTKKFDAMGVATMVQGLVACGANPSLELQRGTAQHIKKGLARASQGMGGTPVWILLGALLQAGSRLVEGHVSVEGSTSRTAGPVSGTNSVTCPELLDELLQQVAAELSQGSVSSSRLCRQVLPALAAALVPGGCWARTGFSYTPRPGFCAALCDAMLELQGAYESLPGGMRTPEGGGLPGLLWLGLLVRFGDMAGFRPSAAWVQAASLAVLGSWGGTATGSTPSTSNSSSSISLLEEQGTEAAAAAAAWQAAPASQFAVWLSAVGRLQHEPSYLPGWPDQALARLQVLLEEMNGHELSVALLGVAHQQQLAEMAAAGAILPANSSSSSSGGVGRSMLAPSSSSSDGGGVGRSMLAPTSSSSSSMLAALSAAKLQLLPAAEAASWQHLHTMDADDLATLAHALQQLEYSPAPAWVEVWAAAVTAQLPVCRPAAAVLQLVALAGFSARPSGGLLQGLVSACQAGMGQLQLQELLGFARALLFLEYRPEALLLQDMVKAGQAAAAAAGVNGGVGIGEAVSVMSVQRAQQMQMLLELQRLAVALSG